MKFDIIKASGPDLNAALRSTVDAVNKAIVDGWTPHGSVSVSSVGSLDSIISFVVCQAVIKS